MMAVVRVSNTSAEDVGSCALTFQVPSGWEIRNTRLYNQTAASGEDPYEYRDFRDDKACTYFSLKKRTVQNIHVVAECFIPGEILFPQYPGGSDVRQKLLVSHSGNVGGGEKITGLFG